MLELIKSKLSDSMGIDPSLVTPEASFKDDLELDSLDLMELVMAFEEEYGIEIKPEDYEKLSTVGAFIDYLKAHGIEG